jgi:glycerol-3-phosphate cytidylyltransferase
VNIGFVAGSFDIIHPGYMYMFREAKQICDHLVVGLHTDPSIERPQKIKPVLSAEERRIILSSIKYIDEVKLYDTEEELLSLMVEINPDVRFLGDDYKNKFNYTGYGVIKKTHYLNRDHGWSTTKLKNLIYRQIKKGD